MSKQLWYICDYCGDPIGAVNAYTDVKDEKGNDICDNCDNMLNRKKGDQIDGSRRRKSTGNPQKIRI